METQINDEQPGIRGWAELCRCSGLQTTSAAALPAAAARLAAAASLPPGLAAALTGAAARLAAAAPLPLPPAASQPVVLSRAL